MRQIFLSNPIKTSTRLKNYWPSPLGTKMCVRVLRKISNGLQKPSDYVFVSKHSTNNSTNVNLIFFSPNYYNICMTVIYYSLYRLDTNLHMKENHNKGVVRLLSAELNLLEISTVYKKI